MYSEYWRMGTELMSLSYIPGRRLRVRKLSPVSVATLHLLGAFPSPPVLAINAQGPAPPGLPPTHLHLTAVVFLEHLSHPIPSLPWKLLRTPQGLEDETKASAKVIDPRRHSQGFLPRVDSLCPRLWPTNTMLAHVASGNALHCLSSPANSYSSSNGRLICSLFCSALPNKLCQSWWLPPLCPRRPLEHRVGVARKVEVVSLASMWDKP